MSQYIVLYSMYVFFTVSIWIEVSFPGLSFLNKTSRWQFGIIQFEIVFCLYLFPSKYIKVDMEMFLNVWAYNWKMILRL